MATLGHNIIVQIEQSANTWMAVAATRTDVLRVNGELLEIASRTSGEWREYLAGRKGWSLQTGWLFTSGVDIRKVLMVGTRVRLRIGGRNAQSGEYLTGYAFVTTAEANAPEGNIASGSFAFTGTGELA